MTIVLDREEVHSLNVKRHFPKENPLHKIFNKNTLKVSYSCMDNVASVLSAHKKYFISKKV